MSKQLTIGLFGFGCVGQGLYEVLNNSLNFKADFKKICIKHADKKRILDKNIFTTNKWEILDDAEIDTVIELIDDADQAYEIIATALKRKKNVVTANKKVVAEHLEEFLQLQKENNVSLIYEASVCGGIPIIRTLEEYYDNETLASVSGIFNGSSNFILTKIFKEGLTYSEALEQAQKLGFAETDPTLDVGGFDPKYKLIILALHAFGVVLKPTEVFNSGINNIHSSEEKLYNETGISIKLTPTLKKINNEQIVAYVIPQLVNSSHKLYNINNEYNAVIVEGIFSNEQLFIGKGAGGHPTGSAVLSDISALSYGYKYEYKKYYLPQKFTLDNSLKLDLYISGHVEALSTLFTEAEINKVGKNGIVLTQQSLQWLIEQKGILEEKELFIAQLHDDVAYTVKDWIKQHEEAVIPA